MTRVNVQRLEELVQSLRLAPEWTAPSIGALLEMNLQRDRNAPANAKVYLARGDALFPSARFWQPVFGISKGAVLSLDVSWDLDCGPHLAER